MTVDVNPSKHLLVDFLIDHVKYFGAFPTEYEDETGVVHSWSSYWYILTGD